ncbi:MAG: hypothetical protein ACRDJM_03230 [Actinomycetota bacterium]
MRRVLVRRLVLMTAAAAVVLTITAPVKAQVFQHRANGSGTDGLGNRLSVLAGDNFLLGGLGIASVRLANDGGPAALVFLDCVIFDERPGNGFHFMYSSGTTLGGRRFYIGVFDDHGAGRTGPYDVMYTQTTPVIGPCNVAAVSSYPIGWDPVSSGDFVVQ